MSLSKKIIEQRLERIVAAESRQLSPFDVPDYWKKSRAERLEMIRRFAHAKLEQEQPTTVEALVSEAVRLRDEAAATDRLSTRPPRPAPAAGVGSPASPVPRPKPSGSREIPAELTQTGAPAPQKFIPRPGGVGAVAGGKRDTPTDAQAEKAVGQRLVEKAALSAVKAVVLDERGMRYTLIHSGMEAELQSYINRMWDSYRYAFDFEANTADPLNDRDTLDVSGISFSIDYGEAIYIPINHWGYGGNWGIEVLERFRALFESRNHLKIPFNMAYEDMVLAILGYDLKLPIFDPFLGLNLLKTAPQATAGMLGLKANVKERFGYDMITFDEITTKQIISGYDKAGNPTYTTQQVLFNELIPDERVLEYGGADSDWALRLADPVMEALKAEGLYELLVEVDIPLQKALTRTALVGWHGDAELFEALKLKCQPLIDQWEFAFLDDVKKQMRFPDAEPLLSPSYWRDIDDLGYRQDLEAAKKNRKFVVEELMSDDAVRDYVRDVVTPDAPGGQIFGYSSKPDPKKGKTTVTVRMWDKSAFFNMGSWQQLAKLWYDVLKLKSVDQKDPRGTNEEIVGKLKKNTPLKMFDSIIEWRGYTRLMSTYLIGYSACMHPETHKVHTTLDQVYVRTGRFSSTKPNL